MSDSARFSLDRRNFLIASASAALAATALPGCAASVNDSSSGGAKGGGTISVMTTEDPKTFQADAQKALGMTIRVMKYDPSKLNAMLASKNPPDVVRGIGALETPYFAKRGLMTDLDPYFAKSSALRTTDLDPVNDLWRFDGQKQGAGPRYGMAKDYSQDSMFWYRTDLFHEAGIDLPSDTEPLSCDEWLDLGKRLTKRRLGKVKVYGLSAGGMGTFAQLTSLTASAGGSVFAEDLASVDFSAPEARKALQWILDYTRADIGPNVANPNPDGWDWPTYQANRMAMATDGYWFGGSFLDDPKIGELSRFAPAPQLGSNRVSPCFGATGFWIPRESKNKDAAWKFFEWYFGGKPAQDRATGGWGIPSLKSLQAKMPQEKPFQKQAYKVQENEMKYFSTLSFTPYAEVTALEAVLNKVLPGAVKSNTPTGKIADELNQRMNEQLARGKELAG
ncbi:extracellular solute-binding protein [Streptomyces graminilatus]|uniref:extracellular solute-binding protein n=1 Tax=Streptomyces graminilatus TaxID=1464070 RepID=UPI0006E205B1|nr:extracellular solute-binding protein [Streptomyces graminilatus]